MIHGQGTVEIEFADFWDFVRKHHPELGEVFYGVPRVNKSNQTLEIDIAFATECNPRDWAEKSKAEKQWEEIK
jgi:hypothetical protein